MSKAPRPDVSAATERLQVMASYARIRLSFGAPLLVALCGVKSTAYRVSCPSSCSCNCSRTAWCTGSHARTEMPHLGAVVRTGLLVSLSCDN